MWEENCRFEFLQDPYGGKPGFSIGMLLAPWTGGSSLRSGTPFYSLQYFSIPSTQ